MRFLCLPQDTIYNNGKQNNRPGLQANSGPSSLPLAPQLPPTPSYTFQARILQAAVPSPVTPFPASSLLRSPNAPLGLQDTLCAPPGPSVGFASPPAPPPTPHCPAAS